MEAEGYVFDKAQREEWMGKGELKFDAFCDVFERHKPSNTQTTS